MDAADFTTSRFIVKLIFVRMKFGQEIYIYIKYFCLKTSNTFSKNYVNFTLIKSKLSVRNLCMYIYFAKITSIHTFFLIKLNCLLLILEQTD